MKVSITKLKAFASQRPEGYVEDVLSKGTIEGDFLIISPDAMRDLKKKYDPKGQLMVTSGSGCCGGKKRISPPAIAPRQPNLPPLPTQIKNVTQAAGRVLVNAITGKQITADEEIIKKRKSICADCEFWIKDKERCSKCGCYTRIKITLATESCPEKKW